MNQRGQENYPQIRVSRKGKKLWFVVEYSRNSSAHLQIKGQCLRDLANIFADTLHPPKSDVGLITGRTIP
jgi:hypothetical protein